MLFPTTAPKHCTPIFQIAKLKEETTPRKPAPRSKHKHPVPQQETSTVPPNSSPHREVKVSSPPSPDKPDVFSDTPSLFHTPRKSKRIVPFVTKTLSPVKIDDTERSTSASPTGRKVQEKKLSNKTKLLVQQIKERQRAGCTEGNKKAGKSPEPGSKQEKGAEEQAVRELISPDSETKCSELLSILSTEEKLVFDKYVKSHL